MFKLLILLIIFSVVGSEIQDFDKILDSLERSGSNIESNNSPNQQRTITILLDDNFNLKSKSLGQCRRNSDCFSISYSICSLGKCECRQNYTFSEGKCRGFFQENCEYDSECDPRDSVCASGTCQCPATHYPKDGNCYGFATGLGFPVHSSEACRYLKNSIFSSGSCQCAPGYVQGYGQCLAELGSKCSRDFDCAPRDSVCSSQTCQCPATHYYRNGNCHPKLHESCHFDDQCKVPYSECANGECKCKKGYAEHEQVCYGLPTAKCNKPTDCALLIFDCKSGICTDVHDYTVGELFSSKPGTTAIYGLHLYPYGMGSFDFRLGEPGYNPGPDKAGNLHWVKNFTLDRVALIWSWAPNSYPSYVEVYCRARTSTGKFMSGHILIPGDGNCVVQNNGNPFSTKDWEVLVDLGPVN